MKVGEAEKETVFDRRCGFGQSIAEYWVWSWSYFLFPFVVALVQDISPKHVELTL